jgi:hypothetical protein
MIMICTNVILCMYDALNKVFVQRAQKKTLCSVFFINAIGNRKFTGIF